MKKRALVLMSGGLDSAVLASSLKLEYSMDFLHFSYGQNASKKESSIFHSLSDFYKANKRRIFNLDIYKQDSFSKSSKNPSQAYVSFRNTVFLSVASSYAETSGIREIFFGAILNDGSGFPDCTRQYFNASNRLLTTATRKPIKVNAPFLKRSKSDLISLGVKLETPFELTWSCYHQGKKHCGKCLGCIQRKEAFKAAGIKDPLL